MRGTVRGGEGGFSDGCGMAARRAQAFGRESAESSLCIFLGGLLLILTDTKPSRQLDRPLKEQFNTHMRQNTCFPPSSGPRSCLLTIDRAHAPLPLLGYIEKAAFLVTASWHGVINRASLIDKRRFCDKHLSNFWS